MADQLPFRDTFQSPYEDCGGRPCANIVGQPFSLVRVRSAETDDDIDPEVGSLFQIRLANGDVIDAFEEEVLEGYTWTGFKEIQ